MADKLWNVKAEFFETPSASESGRTDVRISYEVSDASVSFASGPAHGVQLFYNRLNADGLLAVKGVWLDAARRLQKLGLSGSTNLTGSSVKNKTTLKMYRVFNKAANELVDFGSRDAKKRGRSSDDD